MQIKMPVKLAKPCPCQCKLYNITLKNSAVNFYLVLECLEY